MQKSKLPPSKWYSGMVTRARGVARASEEASTSPSSSGLDRQAAATGSCVCRCPTARSQWCTHVALHLLGLLHLFRCLRSGAVAWGFKKKIEAATEKSGSKLFQPTVFQGEVKTLGRGKRSTRGHHTSTDDIDPSNTTATGVPRQSQSHLDARRRCARRQPAKGEVR